MNIQLRDSKTLQTAIFAANTKPGEPKRNALPKTQLHPELLEGFIDADGGGFVVSSDNHIDLQHLANFLPKPTQCTATWTMCGKQESRIPSELVFALDEGGKLVVRTQSVGDVTKLTASLPSDHRVRFDVAYSNGRVTFARSAGEKPTASTTLTMAQLRTEAGKLGVKWDNNVTMATMIERIDEAKKAAAV